MFLTIGEKIRQVRKQYGLKQVAFESFGFSRDYISMLETNKRSLNEEMKQLMYDALDQLTNGLFKENYTYEQFCLTPEQQAEIWLEEHCTLEYGLSDYEIFNEVATKYELFQPLINLNEKIAIHYYTTRDHQRSNEYFLKAISYCNQTDINPAKYYNLVGVNFNQLGQYKDAIAQYKIASYFLSEETGSLK
ncbi:transcriptional regulator, partial [Turicibacter sanguinis]|nr:transcriptional regulator [Turicibacter sanguinis]